MSVIAATGHKRTLGERLHLDIPLLLGILALMGFALMVMYSASGQDLAMMERQGMRMLLSLGVMIFLAQLAPRHYEAWAPYLFGVGLLLLLGVLLFGEVSKGAQRC
ncbi:rod shape-determining protein RodA [Photobacterium aphoticum]|uniref:Rod shape-determining protein RodA n=1 Tax=Photobacterium aphoticum TaxID=754436 RepID=A0A090R2W4_9GAMM|nr:rod shape-determining protein RodA [Photobacterium aphoticum]